MTQAEEKDPLIGQSLSDYQVLEAVASGGMGVVYRGVHPVIQKRAAIKVLKVGSENDYDNLVREAQAANAINHQNIVGIFGIGRLPDGRAYIIMEYLEGQALDQYVAGRAGHALLPQLEVVQLLFDMCAPLAAAHSAQVIHRDLKPSNVFLSNQPNGGYFVKLLDFGLAKKSKGLDGVTEQTARATVAGTPDYMAPEQAQGKAVSPRTDLYALGCMAFEMLTGKVPFVAPTPFDVMVAHVRAPTPRVSAFTSVPKELDDLVFRLMAKKPEERPQSADEVRDALLPMLESLGAASVAATRTGPRPSLSGEFVVRAARASGQRAVERAQSAETDDALPAAPTSDAAVAPVSSDGATDDALPKAKGAPVIPILAAAGLVVVLAIGYAVTRPSENVETEKLPDVVQLEKRPEPEKPNVVEAPVKSVDAGAALAQIPDDDDELDALTPLPSGVTPKKEVRPAPSEADLKKRLATLEQRLRKKSGDSPDPAALQYLAKYRVQATMADTPAQRGKLNKQLDQWERLFLTR
ncbi:MAG: protein kinase [Archangium sp.]|nr:protein kinase [Archangium sp.]